MGLADVTGSKVIVQWHPTAGVLDEVADGAWTTITLPITHLWYRRGIKRGQQRVEAGEFRCTFRDPTRSMDPTKSGAPNYRKGRRQFRVRVNDGSNTHTVFRGITSGWFPDWTLNDFTVTMTGTDRSPALEGVYVPSVFEQTVKSLNPLWWIHGGIGAKPDIVAGQFVLPNVGTEQRAMLTTGIDPGGQPALPFDSSPTLACSPTSDNGCFGLFSVSLPDTIDELTAPFSLSAAFVADDTGAIYSQSPSASTHIDVLMGISWDSPANTLSIYVDDEATSSMALFSDQLVTDGAPHFATANFDGQVLRLKVDLATQKVGPLVAGAPAPRAGLSMLANIADTTRPFPGRIGHLLAWDYSLSPSEIDAVHNAALAPWDGLRSDQVIAKVLDYVGIASSERNLETGEEIMGPSRCEASALTCCERPANTETGLFFFDREGKATFYARDHVGQTATARDTAPTFVSGRIKLQDLKVSMDERTFFTVGRAWVSAGEPLEVVYRDANADIEGELVWDPEAGTEYASQAAALAGAQRAVGDAEARPHFTDATTIAEDVNFAQLLTRDVWDTLDIVGHPGGVEETQASRILEVEHELDGVKLTWTCRLTLEAV